MTGSRLCGFADMAIPIIVPDSSILKGGTTDQLLKNTNQKKSRKCTFPA